jgi:hypothetical protein
MVSKLKKIRSELFIPDPDADFLLFPDNRSRGQKGTGSRIWIRNTEKFYNSLKIGTIFFLQHLKN